MDSRRGGYNDQVGTGGTPITNAEKQPTDPEKANSFEVGMKSEFFDRRLRVNEALFFVRYIGSHPSGRRADHQCERRSG